MNGGEVDPILRTLRIIAAAMAMGIVMFAVIAAALVAGGTAGMQPDLARPLVLALLGLAIAEIAVYVVIRRAILGKLRGVPGAGATESLSIEALARHYMTLILIGCALAEGFSLFGIVILLVSGVWWAAAAPAVGLALIVLQVPTRDKFSQFVSRATGSHWP